MKCIKNTKTLEILRVSDDEAAAKVGNGWEYCPKWQWKSLRDAGIDRDPD